MNGKHVSQTARQQVSTALIAATASFIIGMSAAPSAHACTDFMLPPPPSPVESVPDNLTAVSARTMDFEVNLGWQMQNQAAGELIKSTDPKSTGSMYGLQWKSRYNFIGFTGLQYANDPIPIVKDGLYFDGMNEKGLSAALLWLDETWPKKEQNNYPEPEVGRRNLSIHFVVNYVLSLCDTVECAADLFQISPKPIVWGELLADQMPLAVHLVLHDAQNHSAVIEWLGKQQIVHWDLDTDRNTADQVRVLTNDPNYFEQVWTLREPQFNRLVQRNHFKEPEEHITLPAENVLPGDSSSGSRFVRSFKLNSALSGRATLKYRPWYYFGEADLKTKKPLDKPVVPVLWRVQLANKVIARAEEVYGEYPAVFKDVPSRDIKSYFHTQFTVIRDHSNQVLYVRGIYNQNLRRIVLADVFRDKPPSYTKNQYVDPLSQSSKYKLQLFQDVSNLFEGKLPNPYAP